MTTWSIAFQPSTSKDLDPHLHPEADLQETGPETRDPLGAGQVLELDPLQPVAIASSTGEINVFTAGVTNTPARSVRLSRPS